MITRQSKVCAVCTQAGLTKGGKEVDQSLVSAEPGQLLSCLRNRLCQRDETRPGDKLSCRKPAGSATKQSLSAGYFLNPAILPHGSSHYGHPSQDISGPLRTRIKGKMDQARRGNAESGLLKGKPRVEVGSRENDITYSL